MTSFTPEKELSDDEFYSFLAEFGVSTTTADKKTKEDSIDKLVQEVLEITTEDPSSPLEELSSPVEQSQASNQTLEKKTWSKVWFILLCTTLFFSGISIGFTLHLIYETKQHNTEVAELITKISSSLEELKQLYQSQEFPLSEKQETIEDFLFPEYFPEDPNPSYSNEEIIESLDSLLEFENAI